MAGNQKYDGYTIVIVYLLIVIHSHVCIVDCGVCFKHVYISHLSKVQTIKKNTI